MPPRPSLLRAATLSLLAAAASGPAPAHAFELDDVSGKARAMAAAPFRDPRGEVPSWLLEIGYDQWRDIRFRTDRALWRTQKLPFEAQFFHPGLYYDRVVRVHEIDAKGVREVEFSPDLFDYGRNEFASRVPQGLGFAGFRLHYPLKRGDYKDELIVFLGASYFRALGKEHVYGLSARGLGVDTALPTGEEFPFFREYWLERPRPGARRLLMYALLDSPSVTGAYRFSVRPGVQTVMDVDAHIFFRRAVAKLGLGPLTSMFFFGEGDSHGPDYRPEVHDSDGLLVATADGEWIWRPLINPREVLATSFSMRDLRGFGLLQRDRNFASYEDSEARYELRPNAWIEPVGPWGAGRVELVQLPTPDETNDNIVAYWVPDELPALGEPFDLAYRLHWQSAETALEPPGGWVVQSRVGRGYRELAEDEQQFIVDFAGPTLERLPADAAVQAVVSAPSNGEILETNAYFVEPTGRWRMTVRVKQLDVTKPTELRGFLQSGSDVLTETWSNLVPPR
jgi:glucans biosynthesis protein